MGRGRIIWTGFEEDTLFTAVKDLMTKDKKLTIIKAMQQAQIALTASRRRTVNAITNIPHALRERFIVNELLDKNWESSRRQKRPEGPDPKEERIREMQGELDTTGAKLADAQKEIERLLLRPEPMVVIQNWIAETLALALQKGRELPGVRMTPNQVVPQSPRHHPEPRKEPDYFRPNLLIIGLDATGREEAKKRFEGKAVIRSWWEGPDASLNTLKELIDRADFTFVCMRTSSPATIGAVRDQLGEKAQRVPGGLERVMDEVSAYLVRTRREI